MKQKIANELRRIVASRGLPLVLLAVLGMVTVMPGWVRAQSEATTTFTSPLPGGPKGEHGGPNDELRELLDSIIDRDELLAEVLGLTVEELAAAKEAGTPLDELITEAGLTKETVRTEIQNAITEAVEQAVSDGTITQEQADLILTPPARPQHDGNPGSGHHGPREGGHGPQATPTPTLIATAPAESTPDATTMAATPTAAATTADTAATNGADDNGNRQHHHDQPSAQNSDSGSASSNASSASTTNSESTTADTSATNEQPASDRPNRDDHQRPGR